MLGGFISIGSITSTATATSDGTTGKVTGSTQVQNVSIAGEQITVTPTASRPPTRARPPCRSRRSTRCSRSSASPSSVTNADRQGQRPVSQPELDGLEIQINLNTLDTAANKFASLLPATLVSELPVAIPNEQLSRSTSVASR